LELARAEERTTRPQLSKGAPATEMSDGDECLGQEDGAQGVLIRPGRIRGREQTIDSPLRYGSDLIQRREAHIEVPGAARLKLDIS